MQIGYYPYMKADAMAYQTVLMELWQFQHAVPPFEKLAQEPTSVKNLALF